MNELATTSQQDWSVIEKVVLDGDLSKLSKQDRVNYYRMYCESLGLNPATRPFQYLRLNGKEVLYATKDATEQLRKLHNVSLEITSRERMDDLYVVTALARLANGRTDSEIGAVSVTNLKGEALANAMMKATTKAKRRATLSICGLGVLDESEIHSIQNAQFVSETSEPHQRAPASIAEPTPEPEPEATILEREDALTNLTQSGDPATLTSAWRDVEASGFADDPAFFSAAYDLIRAFYATAETPGEWNAVKAAQLAIGYGDDDELKAVAIQRQREIRAAQQAEPVTA